MEAGSTLPSNGWSETHLPTAADIITLLESLATGNIPTLFTLDQLASAINFFSYSTPGQLPLHLGADKSDHALTLSVLPLSPASLNTVQTFFARTTEGQDTIAYHWLLRVLRLHTSSPKPPIRVMPLGRILSHKQLTRWVVVMDLQGRLFGLLADGIAEEELSHNNGDREEGLFVKEKDIVNVVELGFLKSKMAFLGTLDILKDNGAFDGQGQLLEFTVVKKWESEEVQVA